jgi:hypothetical protein
LPSRRVACTCSFCVTALAGSPLTVRFRGKPCMRACLGEPQLMQCDEVRSTLCAWPSPTVASEGCEAFPRACWQPWANPRPSPQDMHGTRLFDNHMLFNTCCSRDRCPLKAAGSLLAGLLPSELLAAAVLTACNHAPDARETTLSERVCAGMRPCLFCWRVSCIQSSNPAHQRVACHRQQTRRRSRHGLGPVCLGRFHLCGGAACGGAGRGERVESPCEWIGCKCSASNAQPAARREGSTRLPHGSRAGVASRVVDLGQAEPLAGHAHGDKGRIIPFEELACSVLGRQTVRRRRRCAQD